MAKCDFSDRDVLEIFIESVEELLDSHFLTEVKADGVSTEFKWSQTAGFLTQRTGPKRDSVKAFLLTLRFFVQNNEPTSFCRMEQTIDSLDIDSGLKERFRTLRHRLNSYLDKPPTVTFPCDSGAGTRRQVFDAFLYGIFAHANPKKRRRVKAWEEQLFFDDIRAQFDLILLEYLKVASAMVNICRECLNAGIS